MEAPAPAFGAEVLKPKGAKALRICYLDAFSCISGDMTVGALVAAGADVQRLQAGLMSLDTGANFTFEKTIRRGISAIKFKVLGGAAAAHRHLPHILQMIERADMPDLVG